MTSNPNADFRSTVDTPKLFEFVSHLKDKGEVWVFPFDTAQDITSILRKQLSYLFATCLDLRAKMQPLDLPTLQLGPESLRIFVEKLPRWEYLAFATVLRERIQAYESKRLDVELGISFGPVITLSDRPAAISWISAKFTQITQTVEHLSLAFNSGIEKAVGKPGEPGDIRRIIHLASRIADGYAQTIEWTLEFRRLSVEPELNKLMRLTSRFSANVLSEIETYSEKLAPRVKDALANHPAGEDANFTLSLTVPDTTEFTQEIQRLSRLGE